MKNLKSLLAFILSTIFITSCSVMEDRDLWTDRGELDTKLIIAYLLSDIPLPESSEILEEKTVIQGSGLGWSGKITIKAPLSPAETLIFFAEEVTPTGWTMISSTVSEQIILVYKKAGRIATVEILRDFPMFGRETTAIISVVPDDAVQGNPFRD
tara:strand:+ start:332 stop:796 length:465 start_codon:yes stop_codon:yes gene_type:complete